MKTIVPIDPVTRLEGHLKIEIEVDQVGGKQQITDARATGTLFRGFETILQGRSPEDAPHITQRICGVCPVPHAAASVNALDDLSGIEVPNNAKLVRNLVLGANFIDSHILHFYHLAALDFIEGPNMPPWQPSWKVDKRLSGAVTSVLVEHYKQALAMRRKAHELGAILGGRLPHTPAFIRGGTTAVPKSADLTKMRTYLGELLKFIRTVYIPDVNALAAAYSDYFDIGGGPGNLIAFGVFDELNGTHLLRNGLTKSGSPIIEPVDVWSIKENIGHSWYTDANQNLNPAVGETVPQYPKGDAYSWIKSPRYNGAPFEAGPLARMWVNGDYRNGISVMDRHAARAEEALKVANAMLVWVNQIQVGQPAYKQSTLPSAGTAIGLSEAPRGALGHWVKVQSGKIAKYQIITPTCWNASPMDSLGVKGPVEQALIGTPIKDVAQPIEALRVVHSFDPCLSCAVHVSRPKEGVRIFAIGGGLHANV